MLKIAVFVSGRGSNLRAILNSSKLSELIKVQAVISNKSDCPAFKIAKNNLIKTYTLGNQKSEVSFDELRAILISLNVGLIVLAGFLKMIPANFLKNYRNQIINIHPALLPSFGGKGMYGMNVHKAVYKSSAQVSGATVHFIDETYDTGKIIAQKCIDISDVNSAEEIAEHVLSIEHELLPYVIEKFALNKLIISSERVKIIP